MNFKLSGRVHNFFELQKLSLFLDLQPLDCWDREFESRWEYGVSSLLRRFRKIEKNVCQLRQDTDSARDRNGREAQCVQVAAGKFEGKRIIWKN